MKTKFTRIAALVMAVAVCAAAMSLSAFAAFAIPEQPSSYTSTISLSINEKKTDGDGFYTASLEMKEELAQAVAVAYTQDTADEFKALRFTCLLSDALIAECIANEHVFVESDFDFTNAEIEGESVYELVSVDTDEDAIVIVYKLNETVVDSWSGVEDVKNTLMSKMTVTSNAIAGFDSAWLTAAKEGGKITTKAAAIMTAEGVELNDSVFADYFDGEGSLVGYGTKAWTKTSSGGLQGSGTTNEDKDDGKEDNKPVAPTPSKVTTVNSSDKGSLSAGASATAGAKVELTADVEEGYRVTAIKVTDKNGNEIKVTKTEENEFEFTMPNTEVTIEAEYGTRFAFPDETGIDAHFDTDNHHSYMNGYPDGNFRPSSNITRAEVCQMLYNLMLNKEGSEDMGFADVAADAWYATAVNKLASMKAVNGVGNNKFEPNRAITRAEFAAIVARFAAEQKKGFDFLDVSETHWAYTYIATAAANGWINGVGGNKFEPNRAITRAEAATLVNHMLGRMPDEAEIDSGEARAWPDVADSHWGVYEISEATTGHDHEYNEERTEENWVADTNAQ